MQSNANVVPVSASVVSRVSAASASNGFSSHREKDESPEAGRYRLVIEEGPRAGSFVYKTMDRLTGEVIRQFPREQVVEMQANPDYGAGAVIDTTA